MRGIEDIADITAMWSNGTNIIYKADGVGIFLKKSKKLLNVEISFLEGFYCLTASTQTFTMRIINVSTHPESTMRVKMFFSLWAIIWYCVEILTHIQILMTAFS